jgi:hypothetical protein
MTPWSRLDTRRVSVVEGLMPVITLGPVFAMVVSYFTDASGQRLYEDSLGLVVSACWVAIGLALSVAMSFRSNAASIGLMTVVEAAVGLPVVFWKAIARKEFVTVFGMLTLLLVAPGAIVHVVAFSFGIRSVNLLWYLLSAGVSIMAGSVVVVGVEVNSRSCEQSYSGNSMKR